MEATPGGFCGIRRLKFEIPFFDIIPRRHILSCTIYKNNWVPASIDISKGMTLEDFSCRGSDMKRLFYV
jgi:hypothetical protein